MDAVGLGQDDLVECGAHDVIDDGGALGVGELVPDEVRALREGDEPGGFGEGLGGDVAAAFAAGFSLVVVDGVGAVFVGVGEEDFFCSDGIARVAGDAEGDA
jgi:hypothetical protein